MVWQFEPVLEPNRTNRTGSVGSVLGSGSVQPGTFRFSSWFSKIS